VYIGTSTLKQKELDLFVFTPFLSVGIVLTRLPQPDELPSWLIIAPPKILQNLCLA
jgi:hypothetical protein